MTKYFGVVGNRDHIKIDGVKTPFYTHLNTQPDGWLTSLTYAKGFHRPPQTRGMIFDCGAWSYREKDEPSINVGSVITQYEELCMPGDVCVAPDHMLIKGCDVAKRQNFNDTSASAFIKKLPPHLTPMGIVHGMDEVERARHALHLRSLGYRHIGVGGVAARASSPKYCLEAVKNVREAVPDVRVHVMGLSSPNYFEKWQAIGVDSCDGSSHFKQAFTGGAFFALDWSGKLVKHHAARRDNEGAIPDVFCDCGVCQTMRGQNIDTRSYGSNENNMGRAVHNMNMLMLAQKAKTVGVLYLVSCVSKKAAHKTEARKLYTSSWFQKARAVAENYGSSWGILSAEHGLLNPSQLVSPYEKTLNTNATEWARKTASQIENVHTGEAVYVPAGQRYRKNLMPMLHAAGIPTYAPLNGRGIGQQLGILKTARIDP